MYNKGCGGAYAPSCLSTSRRLQALEDLAILTPYAHTIAVTISKYSFDLLVWQLSGCARQ